MFVFWFLAFEKSLIEETDYHQFKSDAACLPKRGFWELKSVKEKHVSSLNFGVSGEVGKLITKNAKNESSKNCWINDVKVTN